jgi:hypothetical protein
MSTDLWLCQDCTLAATNGDYADLTDARIDTIDMGLRDLGPIAANFDGETDDGYRDFDDTICDCCGTRRVGTRHRFAAFTPASDPKCWAYGNGEPGCLFDHADGPFLSRADAASAAADLFDLSDIERAQLERDGIAYFSGDRRDEIGASVIELFPVSADWAAE